MESDKKYWGRISAARALGILGGKRAVRAIQKAIQDNKISPKALKDTLERLGIQQAFSDQTPAFSFVCPGP